MKIKVKIKVWGNSFWKKKQTNKQTKNNKKTKQNNETKTKT